MQDREIQRGIVRATHSACLLVDEVLYRPAVVKVTGRLPRWWSCELARLSMWLDERWQTGFWSASDAPPAPQGLCEACGRRAAWLVAWDWDYDPPEDPPEDFNVHWPVHLCGWCSPDVESPPASEEELARIQRETRARSVSWRWR